MINSDYTFEVTSNDNIGKAVKAKFKKNGDLIKSLILKEILEEMIMMNAQEELKLHFKFQKV